MRLALLLAVTVVFPATDRIPPEGGLLFPQSHALITENLVRLAARASDSASGVRAVRFYASYYTQADTLARPFGEAGRGEPVLIAEVRNPPYETIWDCSGIPDQDIWRLFFYCDIEDSAGNVTPKAGGVSRHVVLDRNPRFSEKRALVRYCRTPKLIDGNPRDWAPPDADSFANDNNRVFFRAAWDRRALYFLVRAADAHLSAKPDSQLRNLDSAGPGFFNVLDEDPAPLWTFDEISFYFDALRDRSPFRKADDFQFNSYPSGRRDGNNVDFRAGIRRQWGQAIECAVRFQGTINQDRDLDTGFTVEIAVPWASLGLVPSTGMVLGFDLFNVDNDLSGTKRMSRGWAVAGRFNNNNPSEWGSLELLGGSRPWGWSILGGAVLMLAGFLMVRRLRGSGPENRSIEETGQAHYLYGEIEKLIDGEIQNSRLNLADMAVKFRMTPDHLGKIIKNSSGLTYPQLLNRKRIEKACELLKKPELTVSEIAFSIGYESLEYFVKIFKKAMGQTPTEYRSSLK